MSRHALRLALLALLMLAAQPAAAACDAVVSLVDFGRLDLKDGGEITGRLEVVCDTPTTFEVALSEGHGDYRLRRMRHPDGAELRYNLYVDATKRRVWGDGVAAGTAVIQGQSDGRKPERFVIYGLVPPDQKVRSGGYQDNLVTILKE